MVPETFYTERLEKLQQELTALRQRKSSLGWLRFGSIVAIIAGVYFLWSLGWPYVTMAALLLLIVFTRLVFADLKNQAAIEHTILLIKINQDECKALDHDYYHFADGAGFMPKEHAYANDLDIFGRASLFQYINRSSSEPGAATLAGWLLEPANVTVILERQAAVKELAQKSGWRQELLAIGMKNNIRFASKERLQKWLQEEDRFISFKPLQWLRYLLPAIILTVTVLTIFDVVQMNVFYSTLFIYSAIAYNINKKVAPLHQQLSKMVDEMDVLSDSMECIENESFHTPLNSRLQALFTTKNGKASAQVKQLKKILEKLDLRYNIVLSAPLNIFLCWNLQQVIDLEHWKHRNKELVADWFHSLGHWEALNSFATLAFNHPGWTFPELKAEHFYIEGTAIGHPLIRASKRVDNFIAIDKSGELMLVTGSNMAGKSTYLRSIGINVILAMAGAPVCATRFCLSPVQIISSMRIADNLEESTSTFYAELKKLKTVIDKVNDKEKVFILLDEILRGTNSLDRHTGSVALIKQLIKHDAAGIIATHDIELAKMANDYPTHILNYHFDVQVSNDELYFDYKLKEGICSSLNASILMRKIGIEL